MLEHLYSDTIHNKKILILGPLPPPLGGVSVHIHRVTQKFIQQNNTVINFDATCYTSRFVRTIQLIVSFIKHKPDIVYHHTLYHSYLEWVLVIIFKLICQYQLVLIDHDCRDLYKRSQFFKKILRHSMFLVNKQVLIGNLTVQCYRDNHIPLIANCSVESPFLPPDVSQEKRILQTYPPELFEFLHNHAPIVCVNAFSLIMLEGKDLYGIDTSIQLIAQLKNQFPASGLVIVLGQRGNLEYYQELQRTIKVLDVYDNIFFLEEQKELWPLFKYSDLFIRPTLSDGFSISIVEALYLGTATLASDVCLRPAKTILFKTDNFNDLLQKTCTILASKNYAAPHHKYHNLHAQ